MGKNNLTWVSEFVLLGLSGDWQTQAGLFVLFEATYLLTLLGNGLILVLVWLDSRLQLPMYFFLGNRSVVDICYTSSGVPQMLMHFLLEKKTISSARCGTQHFFSLALGTQDSGTKFSLLTAMVYEHYVVNPLHCGAAISPRPTVVSWFVGLANFEVEMAVPMHLPTCGHWVVSHVACVDVAVFPLSVERIMGPWTPCRTWREISINKQIFVKLHCVQYTMPGAAGDTPNLI
ncbi:PREDICTED: olfactory receptor 2F1-like [Capra hircus]|uniref:olfactory receptor 2F1-like n=1 Tax=Capra hircus TaxID=9925 RepID=UPI000846C73F|nr:PREDICTED: olfactory receptor 2F1-like [Capra hircus]